VSWAEARAQFPVLERFAYLQAGSVGPLEVSLLGSRNTEAMRMELYLRVRAWEAGRQAAGAHVDIVD